MGRAGRMTALGLLALLLAPGLLGAACPMCSATAGSGMSCPRSSGPEIRPACCAESAPSLSCCDRDELVEPGAGQQAVSAPSVFLLLPPAEAGFSSLQETKAAPPPLPEDPPRDEGTALYTLHSVYLI